MTVNYAIGERRMCLAGFAAMTQCGPKVIQYYARDVCQKRSMELVKPNLSASPSGKLSLQSLVALLFLRRFATLNAMACPAGRGSSFEEPVGFLCSGTSRGYVYEENVNDCEENILYLVDNSSNSQ